MLMANKQNKFPIILFPRQQIFISKIFVCCMNEQSVEEWMDLEREEKHVKFIILSLLLLEERVDLLNLSVKYLYLADVSGLISLQTRFLKFWLLIAIDWTE